MTRNRKKSLLLSLVGIAVVTATALGAKFWLAVPTPPTSTVSTVDDTYRQELEVARRTCEKVEKISEGLAYEGDPLVATDCIEPNRSCEERLGPHAVWSGTARSIFDEAGTEDLIPNCSCDYGYEYLNGTTGLTLDDGSVFNITDGPGQCVERQ